MRVTTTDACYELVTHLVVEALKLELFVLCQCDITTIPLSVLTACVVCPRNFSACPSSTFSIELSSKSIVVRNDGRANAEFLSTGRSSVHLLVFGALTEDLVSGCHILPPLLYRRHC